MFPSVETETVVTDCSMCGKHFRTYVPETICNLPDGGSVFYSEPQTMCPLCDTMNHDLFPELRPGS